MIKKESKGGLMREYKIRDAIEEIKSNYDINEVIKERIGEPQKRDFYHCPFHNEKTPSFHVNPTSQTFYCFGCEKGGDVVNFIQEYEGLSFNEAVSLLGEGIGIHLDFTKQQRDERGVNDKLSEIMQGALKFYMDKLKDPVDGRKARDYLEKREIDIETARKTGKVDKGTNEVTKAIERGQAKMVVVADDISPKEITQHLAALCKEKGIPCETVDSKKKL